MIREIIDYKLIPTLSASPAYTAGDVLFDTVSIQAGVQSGILRGVTIIDKDDVGENCDLYFFGTNVSLGTFNAAPSISDTNAEELTGVISGILANKDLGGVRVASYEFEMPFDSPVLYVAAITSTAFTHTAAGLVLKFRIERMR